MIDRVLGHYRVIERLAAGGMGEVFRARDLRLERDVALKFLPPEAASDPDRLNRLETEARALAAFVHPNIVAIHSIEEVDGVKFLAMEFVEGTRLDAIIPSGGLRPETFFDLVIQLADALSLAHTREILHRDFKPQNVLITPGGQPKILDFGIARMGSRLPGTVDSATEKGLVIGTWPYMAPEILDGQPADTRSDIFSYGVTLYEMATGKRPFQGDTVARLLVSILRDEPVPVSSLRKDFPASLSLLVQACLEKEPAKRPASMELVRDELERIRKIVTPDTPAASIAVMPFTDMSEGSDQSYFCEGIVEELINSLVRLPGVRVASRTASVLCREQGSDIREIGHRLNVNVILEGSVRKSADRLRIMVDLVDVETQSPLWSERYDRKLEDVFTIQDEIAGNVVQMLQLKLHPGETADTRASTADAVAYDYYLRGRKALYQFRRQGIELALKMFTNAIRHDPGYALAYAGIADCWCFLFLTIDRREESLKQAARASRRALELAPNLPEAHAAYGQVLSLSGRHAEAEREFDIAIRLGPRIFDAYYLCARNAFSRGDQEKAARMYEMASEVNPDDYQSPLLSAQIYDDLGRHEEARQHREKGVRNAGQALKVFPDDVRALYMGANGLVGLGEMEKGIEWITLAVEMAPEESMVLYNAACIYAMAGKPDAAIDCLERGVRSGLTQKEWIDNDSNLEPIRSHPRFQALMTWLEEQIVPSAPTPGREEPLDARLADFEEGP